jgi:hypothetical protein
MMWARELFMKWIILLVPNVLLGSTLLSHTTPCRKVTIIRWPFFFIAKDGTFMNMSQKNDEVRLEILW